MPPLCCLSALVIEELLNLLSYGGHDSAIEEGIKTRKQERSYYYCDKDLDAGINVTFRFYVFNCILGTVGEVCSLVLDDIKNLFHIIFPRTFFIFIRWLLYRLTLIVKEILDFLGNGGHDGSVEECVETGE